MINEQTLPFTTTYGLSAADIESPDNSQWQSGVEPLKTLPAAWWNYFVNLFTKTNVQTAADITNILEEMKNVLTAAGIAVNPLITNQLSTAIQYLIQYKIDGRNAYHGIVGRSVVDNPIPTFITTSDFTLAAATFPVDYFYMSQPVHVAEDKSALLGVAGFYYAYFLGATGDIAVSTVAPGFGAESNVIFATIAWNGIDYGLVSDERHSYNRNKPWHAWAHKNIGPMYTSGLALTTTGTGATSTLALSPGEIDDEDIQFLIDAQTTCRQFWQSGASALTFDKVARTTPFKLGPNNRPMYVNSTGYALTEMSSAVNRYINVFFYATTDLGLPLSMLVETVTPATAAANGYTSAVNARAAPFPDISALTKREVKAIYRVVVRADGQVQAFDPADDVRKLAAVPVGTTGFTVNAVSVPFASTPEILSTNVQAAIVEVNRNSNNLTILSSDTVLTRSGKYLVTNLSNITLPAELNVGESIVILSGDYGCAVLQSDAENVIVARNRFITVKGITGVIRLLPNRQVTFMYKGAGNYSVGTPVHITFPATGFSSASDIAMSPDGIYLAVCAYIASPNVQMYKRNGDTFDLITFPATGFSLPMAMSFSPDGMYLAIGFYISNPNVQVYKRNGDTFTLLAIPAIPTTAGVGNILFSPDGNYLAVSLKATINGIVMYKRVGDVFTFIAFPGIGSTSIEAITFSADSRIFLVGIQGGGGASSIFIYRRVGDVFTATGSSLTQGNSPLCVKISPDNKFMAVGTYTLTGCLRIYMHDGSGAFTLTGTPSYGPASCVNIAFSPDSQYLAVGFSTTGAITLLKREGEVFREILTIPSEPGAPTGISFSPDSAYLGVSHDYANTNVQVYKWVSSANKKYSLVNVLDQELPLLAGLEQTP